MDKNKIKYLFLGLILIVSIFLRIYKLQDRMIFDWDQERDAFAINTILIDHKPLLIGPRVVNDSGFMLGPYFFYLLAPFYLFTGFSPYTNIYFVGFYSILFLILSFFTIKSVVNKKTAIIFCCLWSLLPQTITIDTIAWNPLLVPFLIMLFIHLLNKMPPFKPMLWYIFGLVLGISLNIHVQLAILIPWTIYYFATKKDFILISRHILQIILGIITTFIPLIIFDFRHNWINFHLFQNFIQSTNIEKHILSFIPVWNNFITNLTYVNNSLFPIFLWIFIEIIFIYYSKNNKIIKSIAMIWVTWPIVFMLYGKRPSEYYFNFTLPLIILAFSLLLSKILKNILIVSIIFTIFAIISINNKINNPTKTPFSLENKVKVAYFIKTKVGEQKFNISYSVPAGYNSGYNYLLTRNGTIPTNNPLDPLIQIVVPPTPSNTVFGGIGIQLPQTFLH